MEAPSSAHLRSFIRVACAVLLTTFVAGGAQAQVHEARDGEFTMRANALASTSLPAVTARAHGIRPAASIGVLDVVVLQGNGAASAPVPAAISATVTAPGGVPKPIEMRPAAANGRISYFGTFEIPRPGEAMAFRVRAQPRDTEADLDLRFSDEIGPRQ